MSSRCRRASAGPALAPGSGMTAHILLGGRALGRKTPTSWRSRRSTRRSPCVGTARRGLPGRGCHAGAVHRRRGRGLPPTARGMPISWGGAAPRRCSAATTQPPPPPRAPNDSLLTDSAQSAALARARPPTAWMHPRSSGPGLRRRRPRRHEDDGGDAEEPSGGLLTRRRGASNAGRPRRWPRHSKKGGRAPPPARQFFTAARPQRWRHRSPLGGPRDRVACAAPSAAKRMSALAHPYAMAAWRKPGAPYAGSARSPRTSAP